VLNHDTAYLKRFLSHEPKKGENRKPLFTINASGQVIIADTVNNKPLATLTVFARQFQYMISTPDGYFDCSNSIVKRLYWKDSTSDNFYRFEALYNDFFYPDLLPDLVHNRLSKSELPVQFYTKIPAIIELVKQNMVIPLEKSGKFYLCFTNIDAFSLKNLEKFNLQLTVNNQDGDCKYQVEISEKVFTILSAAKKPSVVREIRKLYPYPKSSSNLIVFSAGIQNYPSSSNLEELSYSHTAVSGFNSLFSNNATRFRNTFDSVIIRPPLIDSAATLDGIIDGINWLISNSKENDCVVIYLIGHGMSANNSQFFHFFPYDGVKGSDDDIFGSTLHTALIADLIRVLRNKRIILVLDACESFGAAPAIRKVVDCMVNQVYSDRNQAVPCSINILFSSLPYQLSQQTKAGSMLGNLIEKSFNELLSSSGRIDMDDLFIEVEKQAGKIHNSMLQTPVFIQAGDNFDLIKSN
jgi:hypothetical protein